MQYLAVIISAILIALILGAPLEAVLIFVLGILGLIAVSIVLFFAVCAVQILTGKKCRGKFVKFDISPKHKFETAFYNIEGEQYQNVFPCEAICRERLYNESKTVSLWLCKKGSKVYDSKSLATVIIGLIAGSAGTAGIAVYIAYLLK